MFTCIWLIFFLVVTEKNYQHIRWQSKTTMNTNFVQEPSGTRVEKMKHEHMTGLFWIYWSQFIWCKKQHFWSSGSRAKGVVLSATSKPGEKSIQVRWMKCFTPIQKFVTSGSHGIFSWWRNFFLKTTQKFTHFLPYSRQNMCRNVEIDSKMWKIGAFYWFNPISNHLRTFVAY